MDNRAVIAIIIFQEIHSPLRKGPGICKFMLKAPRIPGTRQVSRTGIHTEFQPLTVNIVSHSLHTMRKLHRIRHKPLIPIPLLQ